jgi:hypothetical protein
MAKRKKKKLGLEGPTSDCLLLCDDVLISQGKNKHNLIGLIGGIAVRNFPAILEGYVAYARFSNVYGGQKITLKLSRGTDDATILEAEVPFPSQSDPLGVYTIVIPVPAFKVEEPGRYLFGAYHNGVPVASSPIIIQGPPTDKTGSQESRHDTDQ